jgi:hypothetical protein
MLRMMVLNAGSPYDLGSFLSGPAPAREEVAVAQTITSA